MNDVLETGARFLAQQTVARYALALDRQDLAELTDLHTEDAVWEFSVAGSGAQRVAGRAEIVRFVRSSGDPSGRRHLVLNIVVGDVDAGTVELRAYLLLTAGAGIVTAGSFRFLLRDDGSGWRIAELSLDLDSAW